MMTIVKYIKIKPMNEQGSVLVYTIVMFSVVFILSLSVLSIFSSNLFQAKRQENYMEAYYLSYSGALMAFSAVTQDSNELLEKIVNNNSVYEEKKVDLGKGHIDIEAKKSTDSLYHGWIEITSVSTLDAEKTSAKSVLYIDPDNPNNVKWKTF